MLTVALSLPLRNVAALQAKVDAASDPSSPTYRQWLTAADLEAYLPLTSDFSTLKAWAASKGLQVSSQPSHRVAGLIGTVAQIERALFVNMITAQRPDGTVFYAPDRRPTLDLIPLVQGISSLDSFAQPVVAATGGRAPIAGAFQSNDFRDAYLGQAPSHCATLTGAGQSVGVYTIGAGIDQGDVDRYVSKTGLTGVPTPTIVVAGTPDGATPVPLPLNDATSPEISLDVEMVIAMAPKAQVVIFQGNDMQLILDAMANRSDIAQFTSSFSSKNDASLQNFAAIADAHLLIAAQGHAFFQSSGDHGSYPIKAVARPPGADACAPPGAKAEWDMPFITFVGGTNFDLKDGVVQGAEGS